MKLSIKDRVILPGLLVLTHGKKLAFLREVQAFIKEIEIGDLEKKEIGWKQDGGNIRWTDSAEHDVEFELSKPMLNNIVECFERADAINALTLEHIPIYDKFAAYGRVPDVASEGKVGNNNGRSRVLVAKK